MIKKKKNKGVLYENKINNILKTQKLQRTRFKSAGSHPDAPDCEIRFDNNTYFVEVKMTQYEDFGQSSLEYDHVTSRWHLTGADTEHAIEMRKLLDEANTTEFIMNCWGNFGSPKKYSVSFDSFTKDDMEYDYQKFKEIIINIPNDIVSKYYNKKNVYYMQIGKLGLYYMGEDIAELDIPEFLPELRLRCRIKRTRSNKFHNYRFVTALEIIPGTLKPSFANLENHEFVLSLLTTGIT